MPSLSYTLTAMLTTGCCGLMVDEDKRRMPRARPVMKAAGIGGLERNAAIMVVEIIKMEAMLTR